MLGNGYLDDFGGHLLWLAAMVALLQQTLHRLAEGDEQRALFDALVRWPVTLIVPLMFCAMYEIAAHCNDGAGSIALATDPCAAMWFYRITWWSGMVYLTALLLRLLLVVRNTSATPSRVTSLYLLACVAILVALCARVASWWGALDALQHIPVPALLLATILIATAAAASWLGKMRSARPLLRMTRTTRRSLRRDTLESHRLRVILAEESFFTDESRREEPPPLQQTS